MHNKDVSICKRVILDMISELKQKEKKVEFAFRKLGIYNEKISFNESIGCY